MIFFISLLPLLVFNLIAIFNSLTISRLGSRPLSRSAPYTPRVSVLVPARNETTVIGASVRSLLSQTYPTLELLVLDDQSQDGTAEVVRQAGQGDSRLQLLEGQPLPKGWLGKNWACHQLGQQARGEILIFTDADVQWQPTTIEQIVVEMATTKADLLSLFPTQKTVTWAERLTVPLIAMATLGYLPWTMVHFSKMPAFSAANGQCMAFRWTAYNQIGGHFAVRNNVLEDVTLARLVKKTGLTLRLADGNHLLHCQMYTNWQQVRHGFAKNILAGYGGRVSLLLLATLFHGWLFLLPYVWLVTTILPIYQAIILIGLGMGVRGISAGITHQRIRDTLLIPISVLLMTLIAGQAITWHYGKRGQWKGRSLFPI